MGETHEIKQGEGGELGDAMMPLLYRVLRPIGYFSISN